MAHLSSNIFARLETLKKWQEVQQQRLLQQQTEQNDFLSNEQRRLNEALDNKIEDTPVGRPVRINTNKIDLEQSFEEEIICPKKDFNELLNEKLKEVDENDIDKTNMSKPKKPFLKKGTGLVRYRMTGQKFEPQVTSTSHKTRKSIEKDSQNTLKSDNVKSNKNTRKSLEKESKNAHKNDNVQKIENKIQNGETQNECLEICERATWRKVLEQTPVPSPGELSLEQRAFEKQLERELQMKKDLDELRIFELLEQKALNSSFCSTSSVITRLLGNCTPTKTVPVILEKSLETIETPEKVFKDESTWESETESESTLSESSEAETSIAEPLCRDVFTNTEVPYPTVIPPNTDLLRTRLEQLEKEIETFREENSKVTKIKNDLSKEKNNFQKEIQEERKQLEEEKKRMGREKQLLHDKYVREMKNGSRKEREELTALKNQLAQVKEELKLKESRYGASQARQRNQIRTLEKEVASLKAENEELRRQNGKLQSQINQQNKRQQPPSETKVLHEINRNLTLLTKQNRRRTISGTSSSSTEKENEIIESPKNKKPLRKHDSIQQPKSDQSFDSLVRDYEKMFGSHQLYSEPKNRMDGRASSEGSENYLDRNINTACADRIERLLPDGTREITYSNGNVKSISGDKITMNYYNGDVKETNQADATVKYYYSEANIWHTTYAETGLEILEFPDGQIEKRGRDGNTEVTFPDGCIRSTSPLGTETVHYPDGTVSVTKPEGEKVLTLPNGQKEIHTAEHKRREYPDGTIKILYPDGTQETRYANGRIRLKDINGQLIMDTEDGV